MYVCMFARRMRGAWKGASQKAAAKKKKGKAAPPLPSPPPSMDARAQLHNSPPSHLCDCGTLDALTPDDKGLLREWTSKYCMIVDARLPSCALAIFSRVGDAEPEVVVPLEGATVATEQGFPRCFTLTTSDSLRVFLRAPTELEKASWMASVEWAAPPPAPSAKAASPVVERIACGYVKVQLQETASEWANMFAFVMPGVLHLFSSPLDLAPEPSVLLEGKNITLEDRMVVIRGNDGAIVYLMAVDAATETQQWYRSICELQRHPVTRWDVVIAAGFASDYLRKKAKDPKADAASMYLLPEAKPQVVSVSAHATWRLGFARAVADIKAEDFSVLLTNSASTQGNVEAKGTVAADGDQVLALSLTPRLSGKHFLHVRFRNYAILGSPFELNIMPMAPSAKHSLISAISDVVVNVPATFEVTLRDKLLNLCRPLEKPSDLQVVAHGPARVDFVRDEGDGSYSVGYTVLGGGSPAQLAVTLFGAPIAGSPVLPRVVAALPPAQQKARGAMAAEHAAAGLSTILRKDFATPAVDAVLPREEQVQLLMTGAAIRASKPMPREAPVIINGAEWTPEPLPPPWAPPSVFAAFARRMRRDLDEVLAPLVDAARREWAGRLEPASAWKRLLMDWPGPNASTSTIAALARDVREGALEHRDAIAKLCELVVTAEQGAPVPPAGSGSSPPPPTLQAGLRGRLRLLRDSAAASPARPTQALVLSAADTPGAENSQRELEDEGIETIDAEAAVSSPPPSLVASAQRVSAESSQASQEREVVLDANAVSVADALLWGSGVNTENSPPPELPSVGVRCKLDGGAESGIVRHVGAVSFAPGLWVGLELDRAVGRNDGAVQGVRYFSCAPGKGLFVRPERVRYAPTSASSPPPPPPSSSLPQPISAQRVSPRQAQVEAAVAASPPRRPLEASLRHAASPSPASVQRAVQPPPPPRDSPKPPSPIAASPANSAPRDLEWERVEQWLQVGAGVVLQYETKAAKAAFREAGLTTLAKVSRLNAQTVNQMRLSFDLRLRLLSAARELHKTLTFQGVNTSALSTAEIDLAEL